MEIKEPLVEIFERESVVVDEAVCVCGQWNVQLDATENNHIIL